MNIIDDDELTLTIAYAYLGARPPSDVTTTAALNAIRFMDEESLVAYRRVALAVVLYLSRCGAIDIVGVENVPPER